MSYLITPHFLYHRYRTNSGSSAMTRNNRRSVRMKRSRDGAIFPQNATAGCVDPEAVANVSSPQSLTVHDFEAHVKSCQIQSFSFDYYMHGLVEEAGEVFEAVRATQGADPRFSEGQAMAIALELGDVLWYLTSLSMEIGGEMTMLDSWPTVERGTNAPEVLMMLYASKLSGRVKKSMRGDKTLADFVPAMREYRDELLKTCAEVAANFDTTLQRCAKLNVNKLRGRFGRGAVMGDGAYR